MKPTLVVSVFGSLLVLLASCSSLPSSVTNALGSVASNGSSSTAAAAAAAAAAPIGFPAGDVLATSGTSQLSGRYWVVKVITPPSAATKNEAKVIRVSTGQEYWANFVTPTHKTAKAQLALGAKVFSMPGDSSDSTMDETTYAHDLWQLGRVTSVDDLFKGEVQIDGSDYYIKWTRMAN